jgi:hypothetical protein
MKSLLQSADLIQQIVVVSSGTVITEVLDIYKPLLNINHLHLSTFGQIIQKEAGIKLIDQEVDWVLFLDDDVTVPHEVIKVLIENYLTNPKYAEYVAIGLKVQGIQHKQYNSFYKFVLKIFGLYSSQKGKILPSGHAQNYQDSVCDIETEWLNGISIWKSKFLKEYSPKFVQISPSSYEDVLFSYKISRNNRMLFAPKISVCDQNLDFNCKLSLSQFKNAAYMRYLLVSEYQNLSKGYLLFSQILRSFEFIANGDSSISISCRIKNSFAIWFDLMSATLRSKNTLELLKKRFM